jgi:hypothetical protein
MGSKRKKKRKGINYSSMPKTTKYQPKEPVNENKGQKHIG